MRYILASIIVCLWLVGIRATAADGPAPEAARVIHLEVVIADAPEGTTETLQPAAILALEKSGKLSSVTRFKLTTMENQRAMVKFGEMVPRAVGRTVFPGGRGGDGGGQRGATNYSDISIGTMLHAVARVESDSQIAIDLKLERSKLVPQSPDGAPEAAGGFTPSSVATLTVENTVKAKPGEPVLVGGRHTSSGKETTQTWVVLTATVAGGAGKTATGGAAANQIKIFPLKYASAADLAIVLQRVFADWPVTIAAEPRSNSILVRGPTERLTVATSLLSKLDSRGAAP